jgi:predicted nucleic acid-binding protein
MYLFDTDILSNLVRRSPSATLISRIAATAVEQQFSSSITVGELIYGAHRNRNRTTALLQRIEEILSRDLIILPFDSSAARRYGELRADLETRGVTIGDSDTRIAAIALHKDLTIVTGNTRHFKRVPNLRVENWLD